MNEEKNYPEITDLRKGSLTTETLRSYKGFENISEEEATDIILSLRAFAALVFEYCKLKQNKPPTEIININPSNNLKQAA